MKKKLGRKALSLLLATIMLLGTVPFSGSGNLFESTANALTEGYYTYEVDGGFAIITFVDAVVSGDVTIPSALGGYTVTGIGDEAFYYRNSITSVIVPNTVTDIGHRAFYNCADLTSVVISNGVVSIGEGAFQNCKKLTSIILPDSVTNIGLAAFTDTGYYDDDSNWENDVLYICNHLIKADTLISGEYEIKDGTKTVADAAFFYSPSLTGITIPNTVKSIGIGAFQECNKLPSIVIPNGVVSICDKAFYNCTALTSVTIADSVTSIGDEAFYNCAALTNITVPDSVTDIGVQAFNNCTSLTNIEVDGDNPNYSSLDGVLFNKDKTKLIQYPIGNTRTSYTVPTGVTCIGLCAFNECKLLTNLTIPSSVMRIDSSAFAGCSALTSIILPDSVKSLAASAFYNTGYYNDYSNWEDLVLYLGNHLIAANHYVSDDYTIKYSTKTVADGAFYFCEYLTGITIPKSVTSIGERTFCDCRSLTSVTIPNSVTSIGEEAFMSCLALTSITIPESVTIIGDGAFANYSNRLTIFGFTGSYAETYANANNINFSSIGVARILTPVVGSGCVIDRDTDTIYGLKPGLTIAQFESDLVGSGGYSLQYSADVIGTGTVVAVLDENDEPVETYTIVIFGDISGDAMIDSMDSGAIVDYENFFVDWEPTTDYALLKAGDVNGDGVLDGMDAGIIVDAENYIVEINQSTGLIAG